MNDSKLTSQKKFTNRSDQIMFEFFVFQPGGLVLWPLDVETQKTKRYIDQHIQSELMGSHDSKDDKVTVLHHHNTEYGILFAVTVNKQIGLQIKYLPDMLAKVEERFLHQYERILDKQSSVTLVPAMFTAFDVGPVIDEFRGMTTKAAQPSKVEIPIINPKDKAGKGQRISKSVEPTTKKPPRERFNQKKVDEAMVAASQVIGSREEKHENVEQYDLDDFEGVFQPTQKPATTLSGLFKAIVGEKTLTETDVSPVLTAFEQHLIDKNVAAHIASDLTKDVGSKLIGSKCGNFANIKQVVTASLKESIERILTPHRPLDIIRDIQSCKAKGEPFVMAFVGVNGVGKSTSLSKVAYLFKSHGFRVLIAACDTYRTGAVDQLKVHSGRLDVDLYEKGGNRRDPVPVAKQAKEYAKKEGYDVLLIDTAGRMQNDLNLMKQIARLINETKPELTVFVAEALVGNNGSDQIQSFDKALREHNGGQGTKGIDGIILTKFDTIDDKVGASLTLVFETGHPIVYLGVGQHYRDLRRMNPEFVVSTLLAGF